MTLFASVRFQRLSHLRVIEAAAVHANRMDATSKMRLRDGADSSLNLFYNPWTVAQSDDQHKRFDYVADFKRMKEKLNARERGGTAPASHLICQVSPEWFVETGDLHDPNNSRNRLLFAAATEWARLMFGQDSVLSARMDLDEKGGGNVDVFVAPIAKKLKRPFLSVSPRLEELRKQYHRKKTFEALQDSWAEFVQAKLDDRIQRGKMKEGIGDDRLTPENHGAREENKKAAAAIEKAAAAIENEKLALAKSRAELKAQRQRMAAQEIKAAKLARMAANLAARRLAEKVAVGRAEVAAAQEALAAARVELEAVNAAALAAREESGRHMKAAAAAVVEAEKATTVMASTRLELALVQKATLAQHAQADAARAEEMAALSGAASIRDQAKKDGQKAARDEADAALRRTLEAQTYLQVAVVGGGITRLDENGDLRCSAALGEGERGKILTYAQQEWSRFKPVIVGLLAAKEKLYDEARADGRTDGREAGIKDAADEADAIREKAKKDGLAAAKAEADAVLRPTLEAQSYLQNAAISGAIMRLDENGNIRCRPGLGEDDRNKILEYAAREWSSIKAVIADLLSRKTEAFAAMRALGLAEGRKAGLQDAMDEADSIRENAKKEGQKAAKAEADAALQRSLEAQSSLLSAVMSGDIARIDPENNNIYFRPGLDDSEQAKISNYAKLVWSRSKHALVSLIAGKNKAFADARSAGRVNAEARNLKELANAKEAGLASGRAAALAQQTTFLKNLGQAYQRGINAYLRNELKVLGPDKKTSMPERILPSDPADPEQLALMKNIEVALPLGLPKLLYAVHNMLRGLGADAAEIRKKWAEKTAPDKGK